MSKIQSRKKADKLYGRDAQRSLQNLVNTRFSKVQEVRKAKAEQNEAEQELKRYICSVPALSKEYLRVDYFKLAKDFVDMDIIPPGTRKPSREIIDWEE